MNKSSGVRLRREQRISTGRTSEHTVGVRYLLQGGAGGMGMGTTGRILQVTIIGQEKARQIFQ